MELTRFPVILPLAALELFTMEFTAATPDDLPAIVAKIREAFPGERFFALYGEMGAGKTTLVHAFLKNLGVEEHATSPTFSLVNTYETDANEPVFHFDFYRIESEEEVYDIGYEEYFYSNAFCFVEWPEKIEDLLPENIVSVQISQSNACRKIRISKKS